MESICQEDSGLCGWSKQSHGKGRCKFVDGSIYNGEWQHGKITGQGMMVWADGRIYQGQWFENQSCGSGTMIFEGKSCYFARTHPCEGCVPDLGDAAFAIKSPRLNTYARERQRSNSSSGSGGVDDREDYASLDRRRDDGGRAVAGKTGIDFLQEEERHKPHRHCRRRSRRRRQRRGVTGEGRRLRRRGPGGRGGRAASPVP